MGRPPLVQEFKPTEQSLDVFTGDTLVFMVRAMDPDRSVLRQRFTIGDSLVSGATHWTYIVDDTGQVVVRCVVTDGEFDSGVQWRLNRILAINHAPVITSFSPVERNPTMIVDNSLEFAVDARDEDGDPLEYTFRIDGDDVAAKDRFVYTPAEEGPRVVEAVVSDGELSARHTWDLLVIEAPDTIPPATIEFTQVATGAEPGEVDLQWVAVGGNGNEGMASNYLVRTAPEPILDEEAWDRASEQPGVPETLPAGELMRMTIRGMIPGRFTHVAARAVDDFGNLSPFGESPGVYTRGMRITGEVRNALTLEPVPDIIVRLAHFATTTQENGGFEFIELPPIDGTLALRDELIVGEIGTYYNFEKPYVVQHLDHLDLLMLPNVDLDTPSYPGLFELYREMTEVRGIPPSTQQRRWALPIQVYVPSFSANGLDYRQTIVDVAAEFDQIMGVQMFQVVSAVPETGVEILYQEGVSADNYDVTEWTPDWYPKKARIKFRTLYAPATVASFRVIIRHELGHALGLFHSADPNHLMVGGQASRSTWFTEDELKVIRVLYHVPRGTEMKNHLRE